MQDDTIRDNESTICKTLNSEPLSNEQALIEELKEKAEIYKNWANNPALLWNHSTQPLTLAQPTLDERLTAFFIYAAEEDLDALFQNCIRRLDSVTAYHRFKKLFPSAKKISDAYLQEFLEDRGLPTGKKEKKKYHTLLYKGRRCLEFCNMLNKGDEDDDIKLDHINCGVLLLDLDDRMWKSDSVYRKQFKEFLCNLDAQKLLAALEKYGATIAAKVLLQWRESLIEDGLKPSESNRTAVSKRSSTEANLHTPAASKRSRTAADLNDLIEAALRIESETPTTSEAAISLRIMQPNTALSLNSEAGHMFLGRSYDTQNVASHTCNLLDIHNSTYGVNNEPPLELSLDDFIIGRRWCYDDSVFDFDFSFEAPLPDMT
ncbi:hypothetical protein V8C42DRAFT_337201 [Trichoderma barbatum]